MYTYLNSNCIKMRKNINHLTISVARGYFAVFHSNGQLLQSWFYHAKAAPKLRQPLIHNVRDNRNELEILV
jgi:hypothetical protein